MNTFLQGRAYPSTMNILLRAADLKEIVILLFVSFNPSLYAINAIKSHSQLLVASSKAKYLRKSYILTLSLKAETIETALLFEAVSRGRLNFQL